MLHCAFHSCPVGRRAWFLSAALLKMLRGVTFHVPLPKSTPLPALNPGIFEHFMVQSQRLGTGTTRLQWLAGLLWWSHASYQSTTTCKQTGQKQRNVEWDLLPEGRKTVILLIEFYSIWTCYVVDNTQMVLWEPVTSELNSRTFLLLMRS